jgi:murein L,D-transpeptidase YcbB/YkuD
MQPAPAPLPTNPVMVWNLADARALLDVIGTVDSEGLIPADYQPDALSAAIANGPGPELDEAASRSFTWLVEDMRDGRTPMTSRLQWFAVDPDMDRNPTATLMARALETHDVAGVLAELEPTHNDYRALKAALATTPRAETRKRALIQANLDRWRWLPRDLGLLYLITNVPEYQLRLATRDRIVRTYRTIVGKPGRTATPQLAEKVEAVVFNPTWTVPQSIVVGEGLGASLLRNPRPGYKVTRGANGMLTVVQQPGPNNSLGLMKIDMPNPHAIYLHDTPNRNLFNATNRAFSHGCVRTERAQELGMTMAILGADLTPEKAIELADSGKYNKVQMTKTFPVYITYFTMGQDITGKLTSFSDIYQRDAPVLASFNQPRAQKTSQRSSNEAIIKLDNPL